MVSNSKFRHKVLPFFEVGAEAAEGVVHSVWLVQRVVHNYYSLLLQARVNSINGKCLVKHWVLSAPNSALQFAMVT